MLSACTRNDGLVTAVRREVKHTFKTLGRQRVILSHTASQTGVTRHLEGDVMVKVPRLYDWEDGVGGGVIGLGFKLLRCSSISSYHTVCCIETLYNSFSIIVCLPFTVLNTPRGLFSPTGSLIHTAFLLACQSQLRWGWRLLNDVLHSFSFRGHYISFERRSPYGITFKPPGKG